MKKKARKKVLLINPGVGMAFTDFYARSVPVPLVCIGTYLQKKGYEAKIVNALTDKNYAQKIESELKTADFVGLSVMTPQVNSAVYISKEIRKLKPEVPIIWGGIHATLFPKQTAESRVVDFVVMYEGEETFYELMQAIEKGKDPKKVDGICFFDKKKKFIATPRRKYVNLEEMPLCDWKLIEPEAREKVDIAQVHTSRGCPYRCTFCINRINRENFRSMSAERALRELEHDLKYFNTRHIKFREENFFSNRERALKIIDGIIERKLGIKWEANIRANYVNQYYLNDEVFEKMKESGCCKLWFGAESGSEKVLGILQKDLTVEQILEAARMCKKYEIDANFSFMVGIPGETEEDMMETIKLIDELFKINPEIDIAGPQPYRPYPGGPLYEKCIEAGWKEPETLEEWGESMAREHYFMSHNFPWVKNPFLAESLLIYKQFGATTFKTAMQTAKKLNLKMPSFVYAAFILLMKARWKAKFFKLPIELWIANKALRNRLSSGTGEE